MDISIIADSYGEPDHNPEDHDPDLNIPFMKDETQALMQRKIVDSCPMGEADRSPR